MTAVAVPLADAAWIKTQALAHFAQPAERDSQSALEWAVAHAMIRTPQAGLLHFSDVVRDYQHALLSDVSDHIIIVKARQIGVSQALAFIAAQEAIRGGTVVIVSRTGEQAMRFLDYVYTAMRDAPHPPYVSENRQSMELANGGMIITQGATKGAGRGIPASLLILDEFAWMDYADDIYTATLPVLSNGGRVIIASTPNGRANRFYQLWAGGGEQWSRHFLPWHVNAEWRDDPDWERRQRDDIGNEAFAQEYDCDFLVSGLAVFEPSDIDAIWRLPIPVDANRDQSQVEPIAGHRYLSVWDIARKRDAFVGMTLDLSTSPFQLAAYTRQLQASYPDQAATIEARHRRYPGRTVVESNGVGDPLIQFLVVAVEEFVTTARTKRDAIDALKLLLERKELAAWRIEQVERELSMYQRQDDKLVQDCVMALAIAAHTAGRPVQINYPTVMPLIVGAGGGRLNTGREARTR